MLTQFKVQSFRNFENILAFNLDHVKDYDFNVQAIKNGTIKTCVIYGENGSGKTNLGKAITDIMSHLTDRTQRSNKSTSVELIDTYPLVRYYYQFSIHGQKIEYWYSRAASFELVEEKFSINGKMLLYYNHVTHERRNVITRDQYVNTNLYGESISFLKYVSRNTDFNISLETMLMKDFFTFVEQMSLFDIPDMLSTPGRTHTSKIAKEIISHGKLKEFEGFLSRHGRDVSLFETEMDGDPIIAVKLPDGYGDFFNLESSGTVTLAYLFTVLMKSDKYSFVYIDGFDTFLHPNIARQVLFEFLNIGTQTILTTHTTSLINNELLRPDCYFNLSSGKIKSFSEISSKDLQKHQLLERLYNAGHFDHTP